MSLGTPKVVFPEPQEEKLFFETKVQFEFKNFDKYQNGVEVSGEIEIPQIGVKCLLKTKPYYYTNGYEWTSFELTVIGLCEEFQIPDKYKIDFSVTIDEEVFSQSDKKPIKSDSVESGRIVLNRQNIVAKLNSSRTLSLDILISIFTKASTVFSLQIQNWNENFQKLVEEHREMLATSEFSDFKFIVKGEEFKVHRIILAAASPVFSKMFKSSLKEGTSNEGIIKDIEPEIFEDLLHFIYERKLPENLADVALELFEAAHYYEIHKLKEICIQEIPRLLKTENAIEMFNWACVYDENLKKEAWKIVKREVLEVFLALENEPPTVEELQLMIEQKQQNDNFWKKLIKTSQEKKA